MLDLRVWKKIARMESTVNTNYWRADKVLWLEKGGL